MDITMHVTTRSPSKKSPLPLGLLLCGVLCATTCAAEEPDRSLLEDTKLYVTAPLRWDSQGWMKFTGTVPGAAGRHLGLRGVLT
jgi:hypothetical protein